MHVELMIPIVLHDRVFLLKFTAMTVCPSGTNMSHVQVKASPSTANFDDPVRLYP